MVAVAGADFDNLRGLQRSATLRVYNYYRILISFLFLFLFLDENFSEFMGAANPQLFQNTILVYLACNILIGLAPVVISSDFIAKTGPTFVILIADIIGLTLLMSASGGVSSGLGNFLIFTVAFGGGLIYGRISTVLPAIAFILTLFNEFYLFFLGQNELQSFFQAGILGIVYFVANIFFQSLSQQIRSKESEVFSLEQINQIVVDQMRTGVAVVSENGLIKLINTAGKQLLFPKPGADQRTSQLPSDLLDKIVGHKLSGNHQSTTFRVNPDSPALLVDFSTIGSPDDDIDTLIFLEDSTEVQRQAQQLKLAALGRLSASIAHEIRNPLGAISHAAQLLGESTGLDKGDRRLSEIIQNHCIRMNNVIENVLHLSSRHTAEPKTLVVGEWLKGFIEDFSAGYPDKTIIEVEMNNIPKGTTIDFDPLHLSQILGNLCHNGLRYSARHTGEFRQKIKVGIEESPGTRYIEVIDYGQGVQEDLVTNLFEPFYTTETSGSGLGLYLSNELCQANDTNLTYSKADTSGSCFRISFLRQ